MKLRLTEIDGKNDALSYRMERMPELVDNNTECVEVVERRVLEAKGEQATVAGTQKQLERALVTLQEKAEDLEACSWVNNLHIVGLAESTNVENMKSFVEQLLIELLGQETFSDLFMMKWAHRSLAP
ncbi:hypothetical protein NDU88_002671 [Pleurodeles waltl]|uniref:Uncharacterized protein n=1 Tax=Pleurodeles waltl TaxID=8319 RepID=A0AAV7VBV8_PLEWA|nr:hypothetical protein NDU88_002671 [Pleurodeles waltl]